MCWARSAWWYVAPLRPRASPSPHLWLPSCVPLFLARSRVPQCAFPWCVTVSLHVRRCDSVAQVTQRRVLSWARLDQYHVSDTRVEPRKVPCTSSMVRTHFPTLSIESLRAASEESSPVLQEEGIRLVPLGRPPTLAHVALHIFLLVCAACLALGATRSWQWGCRCGGAGDGRAVAACARLAAPSASDSLPKCTRVGCSTCFDRCGPT